MAKKKEPEILNPTYEEKKDFSVSEEYLQDLESLQNADSIRMTNDSKDTFFKTVVRAMNDRKNISMKTEYLNVRENFTATKLEYMAKYANMPYLLPFVKILETKRVSLHRKGRQEDVLVLQERHREMEKDRLRDLNRLFNI